MGNRERGRNGRELEGKKKGFLNQLGALRKGEKKFVSSGKEVGGKKSPKREGPRVEVVKSQKDLNSLSIVTQYLLEAIMQSEEIMIVRRFGGTISH